MRTLKDKIIYYLSHPQHIKRDLEISRDSKIRALALQNADSSHPFKESEDGFYKRTYENQDEYREHQGSKLEIMSSSLEATYESRVEKFVEEMEELGLKKGDSLLCLGSRDGAEVDAARRIGVLAVGIDLLYPEKNPFVHYGDFHNIPYPESCFDYVYTNTLDHLRDPSILFSEIKRVLKQEGNFVGRVLSGVEEGFNLKGSHESFVWKTKQQLFDLIESKGLKLNSTKEWINHWTLISFSKKA